MLHVLTPKTVLSPTALRVSTVPKKTMLRGLAVAPRPWLTSRVFWRMFFEQPLARYSLALTPFPIIGFLKNELALPLAQAPVLMVGLIYLIEIRLLSIPKHRRRALISEADAARALDTFRVRAIACLTQIAAGRGFAHETLHLVVEQSEFARIPPLTLISVQLEGPDARILDLTDAEQDYIRSHLFDDKFSERTLQTVNLAEHTFLRDVALDARTISAHARLAAMAT